jgi:hypothetical protein
MSEEVKTNLSEEEQEELALLTEAVENSETLEPEDTKRFEELKAKSESVTVKSNETTLIKGDGLEDIKEETDSETNGEETPAEQRETIEPEVEEVPEEENNNVKGVIPSDLMYAETTEGEKKGPGVRVARYYTVKTVKEKEKWNQLTGIYEGYLSNGLGCETECFAIDKLKRLKVGQIVVLPESATIRQSNRKITAEEKEKARRDGTIIIPSVFDWLHF